MRLNILFAVLTFVSPLLLFGQFDITKLSHQVVDEDLDVNVFYKATLVDLKMIKMDELPQEHPFYDADGDEGTGTYVMDVRFSEAESQVYHVVYWPGYSADPIFYFYHADDLAVPIYSVECLNLYITGNGHFYTSGHINSFFDLRQKFSAVGGAFRHHGQNFQYVGLKTKALVDLELLEFHYGGQVVTTVQAEEPIEVLISAISDDGYNVFLIKNEFGITGWYELSTEGFYGEVIEGLYFRGD